MKVDYLVVGAGFTGSTFARLKAEEGHKVRVIDKRSHIGGNAHDQYCTSAELTVHSYGPHLFHTNSDRVFEWLSRFTSWRKYEHRVVADMGEKYPLVPIPFNFRSIELCFNEREASMYKYSLSNMSTRIDQRFTLGQLLKSSTYNIQDLAVFIREHVFTHYTQKMWGLTLEELGPTVADRVPIIAGYDDRYFDDKHQALPSAGYTKMFEHMLDHPNIEHVTGVEYEHGSEGDARMLYTGPIDEYFGRSVGALPYRGLKFNFGHGTRLPDLGGAGTLNYTSDETVNTRSTSMRVLNQKIGGTDIVVTETPTDDTQYYPYSHEEAKSLYREYERAAEMIVRRVKFAGRLGSYQYLNMDQAVAQAMKAAKEF